MQSLSIPNCTKEYFKQRSKNLAELISEFTRIPVETINKHGIKFTLEHPRALEGTTKSQVKKLEQLKNFARLYNEVQFICEEIEFTSSVFSRRYFTNLLKNANDKEYVIVAFLNARNKLIATKTVSEGSLSEAPVYPREIVKLALDHDASNIILAHNHPGGSLTFSQKDKTITENIKHALNTIGVKLLDHILVSGGCSVSMAEQGLI
jgi:DNA repair protein RadC